MRIESNLQIVYWPVSKLTRYIRNPRKNDAVVDRICGSIREYGFVVPILAKADGTVIDGDLRLKGAIKEGIAEVPVIVCDGWSEAQVKAFRIMVNRSVTWAEWDDELLSLELQELAGADYNLELTGFDPRELEDPAHAAGQRRAGRRRPAAARESRVPARRTVAVRQPAQPTSHALRRRDQRGGGGAPAGRSQAIPAHNRPTLRYQLRF